MILHWICLDGIRFHINSKICFYKIKKNAVFGNSPSIISFRWFPAANLDYYVASPLGIKLTTMGKLSDIHEFYWINKVRGELKKDESAYFLCTSRDFKKSQHDIL